MFDISQIDFDRMPANEQADFLELLRYQELADEADSLTFYDFVRNFWSELTPATPFIDNWHIGCICEHLTACHLLQIRNLIINIHPRSTKSTVVSVMYPAWKWKEQPHHNFLTASHTEGLALRDASNSRMIIKSAKYQLFYGDRFRMMQDQDAKRFYKNSKGGARSAFGVGTAITGHGGDTNIGDDLNNPQEKATSAELEEVAFWASKKWYSRVNDVRTCVRIITQQRVHVHDVTGHLLEEDLGFEVVKIPFRYEGEKIYSSIGWVDPRDKIGEVTHPERFPEEEAVKLLKAAGTDASAQYQQNPVPKEGGMFPPSKVEKNRRTVEPNNLRLCRFWDKAFTEGGGAYTVGLLMGVTPEQDWWVLDVVRGQWGSTFRDEMIFATAVKDAMKYGGTLTSHTRRVNGADVITDIHVGGRVKIVIEKEPGAAGRNETDALLKMLNRFDVLGEPASGDKVVRAQPFASQWGAGNVYLLEGEWITDYLNEMQQFPNGIYKDQVDGSSGAYNYLLNNVPPELKFYGWQ